MKEKKYVAFGKYRLSCEENSSFKTSGKKNYYRLYEKYTDDFGNESWNQTWSGSEHSSDSGDIHAGILAEALYFRLSTKQ